MTTKSATAIYCDDIRSEVGGKFSLMGVYNADIIFPSFPATLPKLCAHVTVKFPWGEQPTKSLRVVLFKGEDILSEINIDEDSLKPAAVPPPDPETSPEDRKLAVQFSFNITPFVAEGPTRIRLRAYADSEEIKGNALRVRLPTDEERQIFGFPPTAESPPSV